jgi:uncharacterized protein (DUF697 family)
MTNDSSHAPNSAPTEAPVLPQSDRHAIATLCLLAAFADNQRDHAEQERIRSVFESMGADDAAMPAIYQRVLMRQVTVADAAKGLSSAESRTLAYEMAVLVCEADDALCDREKAFLAELADAVKPEAAAAREAHQAADEILELELGPTSPTAVAAPVVAAGLSAPVPATSQAAPGQAAPAANAEADTMILRSSMLAAALELLPQGLASAAIIPLQMNMVYRVGKSHGVALDRGHVKDLLATVGVGVTSQVVEGYARKALSGVLGSAAKKMGLGAVGSLIKGALKHGTGPAITFATTYALGQVAKQYYAGGRRFSAIDLRTLFERESTRAQSLYQQHAPAIQKQAGSLNLSSIRSLIASA